MAREPVRFEVLAERSPEPETRVHFRRIDDEFDAIDIVAQRPLRDRPLQAGQQVQRASEAPPRPPQQHRVALQREIGKVPGGKTHGSVTLYISSEGLGGMVIDAPAGRTFLLLFFLLPHTILCK